MNRKRRRGYEAQEAVDDHGAEVILGPNPTTNFGLPDVVREAGRAIGILMKEPRLAYSSARGVAGEWAKALRNQSELAPHPKDRRFADPAWKEEMAYRIWLQWYLAWVTGTENWVESQQHVSPFTRTRLAFLCSLFNEAIAPTNFPWQPVALRKFKETKGKSGLAGLRNFLSDLRDNRGLPSQVDKSKFSVGQNVACSAGSVVFRSEVMEMIQYQPATSHVKSIPLLIVPPQINKFYIFDLSPEKSVIAGLLNAGFQVFAISWKNPNAEERDWGLSEYSAAIEMAVSVVCNVCAQNKVNVLGACAGGITLASYVAARIAVGDHRVNSMTLMVSVLDTEMLGETGLGVFASERSIERAKQYSQDRGVLDGRDMATAFAWLRSRDLIWGYWVNNTLLGNKAPAFDVLYWNNDVTRLPARLHAEFLDIYKTNALTRAGALRLHGVPVDLRRIECDNYIVGGTTDHITPWRACFRSTQILGGRSTFVLSNSGHMQSILNPPGNPKSEYWTTSTMDGRANADEWKANAERVSGSWWLHWHPWLEARSGPEVPAPESLGTEGYPALEDAPGTYVHG